MSELLPPQNIRELIREREERLTGQERAERIADIQATLNKLNADSALASGEQASQVVLPINDSKTVEAI